MAGAGSTDFTKQIVGHYELERTMLGSGRDGVVRSAIHLPTGKRVAVKIIDTASEQVRRRCKFEERVLRKLRHTNIIKLLDVVERGSTMFMFMEYATGGDLASYMETTGRLDEKIARIVFKQVVQAVAHCHKNKIVHHDIKLENILLFRKSNDIRITDFGLCTEVKGPITEFHGSPLYMPPEIFTLQPHNEAVDVWSLGVCLYYIVTGMFPFTGSAYHDLEEKMLHKDPKHRITLEEVLQHSWWHESRSTSSLNTTTTSTSGTSPTRRKGRRRHKRENNKYRSYSLSSSSFSDSE